MKVNSLLLTIALTILTLVSTSAWGVEMQVVANELKILPVVKLIRVAIGDPKVADVTVLSATELMLMGKKLGTTTLIIWDDSGQRTLDIKVIEQDLEEIAQRIRGLLASADIYAARVKVTEEDIYVTGEVLSQRQQEIVNNTVASFEQVINLVRVRERQPLVEIDVEVLEVGHDDLKRLGLDWTTAWPITYSEPTGSKADGKAPKFWKVFRWDRTGINAKLNFLIQENRARILANPRLVTLSGKEAYFLVGGEIPYVIVESNDRSSVKWRDYGIGLKIQPTVNAKNEIHTVIEAEITDLDLVNAVSQEGFSIPALKKREANTELFLNEGDTVFIAGLIDTDISRNVDRLPWLSKVPILGELFTSTEFNDDRTELVISITPKIIGKKAQPTHLDQEMLEQQALLEAQRGFPAHPSPSDEKSPLTYYTHMIEDIIARNAVYPAQAQQAQEEGIVEIDLYLLANGKLANATIKRSSGFRALDEAALMAVEEQAPYPSFPTQITQQKLRLTVPVVFKSYVKNE